MRERNKKRRETKKRKRPDWADQSADRPSRPGRPAPLPLLFPWADPSGRSGPAGDAPAPARAARDFVPNPTTHARTGNRSLHAQRPTPAILPTSHAPLTSEATPIKPPASSLFSPSSPSQPRPQAARIARRSAANRAASICPPRPSRPESLQAAAATLRATSSRTSSTFLPGRRTPGTCRRRRHQAALANSLTPATTSSPSPRHVSANSAPRRYPVSAT
jgi:hypothetical protein